MKITKFIVVFHFFIMTYAEAAEIHQRDLLTQQEEGFRFRDNLAFNFKGRSKRDIITDFVPIHDLLLNFEKTKKAELGEDFKTKNLASFGITLVIKKDTKLTFVTLVPALLDKGQSTIIKENDLSQHIISYNPLVQKIFVSGIKLKDLSVIQQDEQEDEPEVASERLSLAGVIPSYEQREKISIVDFLVGDLYKGLLKKTIAPKKFVSGGFSLTKLNSETTRPPVERPGQQEFNGIFSEQLGYEKGIVARNIQTILRRTHAIENQKDTRDEKTAKQKKTKKEKCMNDPILSQFWGASLFDSEQTLRLYFQFHIKEIIIEALKLYSNTRAQKKEVVASGERPQKSEKPESISGLLLHVHSEMDMCALCATSLDGFVKSCNLHFKEKETNHTIMGRQNYFLSELKEGIDQYDNLHAHDKKTGARNAPPIRLNNDLFRFQTTVSSRRPYVRNSYVYKRNWTGKDAFSLQASANETMDFYTDDSHCVHKAYFDQGDHPVLGRILDADEFPPVSDRIRGLPGFAQLLPGPVVTSGRAVYVLCALQQRLKEEYALFYGRQINGIARLIYGFCDEVEAPPISSGSSGSSSGSSSSSSSSSAPSGSGGASSHSGLVTSPTTTTTTTTTTSTTASPATTSSTRTANTNTAKTTIASSGSSSSFSSSSSSSSGSKTGKKKK